MISLITKSFLEIILKPHSWYVLSAESQASRAYPSEGEDYNFFQIVNSNPNSK